MLILSMFAVAANAQNVNRVMISNFFQTEVKVSNAFQNCTGDRNLGNCVAIAVIKCALGQFETKENVFTRIVPDGNGNYNIQFADSLRLTLLAKEIQTVKDSSGIQRVPDSRYYEDAVILYASMCKRILLANGHYSTCIKNFSNAMEYLNSGYSATFGAELLGLKKKPVPIDNLLLEEDALIWCSAHAAYVSCGVQDLMGREVLLKKRKMRNVARYSRIREAFKLEK